MKNLYFDFAATTAVYPELNEIISYYNSEEFYNPSALYAPSASITRSIGEARKEIAVALGADAQEIYFTSCATESNNWVLRSVCARAGSELIISAGEHAAVRETASALSARGVMVKVVPLLADGRIDCVRLMETVSSKTTLVSLIHVNNETGAVNDIAAIAKDIKEEYPNIFIHSDGVQAFCKYKTSLKNIDFYSISGHKIHAPKGVGALYVKYGAKLSPLLSGGGQERGERSGTENVPSIVALGKAAVRFRSEFDAKELLAFKDAIIKKLSVDSDFFLNVKQNAFVSPHVLSCGFIGLRGETLMHALQDQGILIGMGSACSSHRGGNSVLTAMGVTSERVLSSVRISLDMSLKQDQIEKFCDTVLQTVRGLKEKLK